MKLRRGTATRSTRCAFSMTEVIVAGSLIGTLLAITVPMIRGVGHQQRSADRQQVGRVEAANILERLTSRPWNEITPELTAGVALSPEAKRQLPEAQLQVAVKSEAARPEEKQIEVAIRWEEKRNAPAAPVRLKAWVYQRGRQP